MRLRNRVREARQRQGITISALSTTSGVSRTTIHQIEGDPKYVPSTPTLIALSDALDDPHLFWLEREPNDSPADKGV